MAYGVLCMGVLLAAYFINISFMSVFYHRGLTHQALTFRPWMRKFVVVAGPWITGLDPKVWACMHRLHHLHSDTPDDPHSPNNVGMLRVLVAQAKYYCETTRGLMRGDEKFCSLVKDLDYPVNWITRHKIDLAPFFTHVLIGTGIGIWAGGFWVGACYVAGLMSHPFQGWMVNALGHQRGYRNYATSDNSTNNWVVAFLALGEGYQNNHHKSPSSANFAAKWWEIDFGFLVCKLAKSLRIIDSFRTA